MGGRQVRHPPQGSGNLTPLVEVAWVLLIVVAAVPASVIVEGAVW